MFFFKGDARSAASDGSVVQNSYDAIEGGGLMGKALGVKMLVIIMGSGKDRSLNICVQTYVLVSMPVLKLNVKFEALTISMC